MERAVHAAKSFAHASQHDYFAQGSNRAGLEFYGRSAVHVGSGGDDERRLVQHEATIGLHLNVQLQHGARWAWEGESGRDRLDHERRARTNGDPRGVAIAGERPRLGRHEGGVDSGTPLQDARRDARATPQFGDHMPDAGSLDRQDGRG